MRNWTFFTKAAARSSLASLVSSDTLNSQGKFVQAVSSIEVTPAMSSLFDRPVAVSCCLMASRKSFRICKFRRPRDCLRNFSNYLSLVSCDFTCEQEQARSKARSWTAQLARLSAMLRSSHCWAPPNGSSKSTLRRKLSTLNRRSLSRLPVLPTLDLRFSAALFASTSRPSWPLFPRTFLRLRRLSSPPFNVKFLDVSGEAPSDQCLKDDAKDISIILIKVQGNISEAQSEVAASRNTYSYDRCDLVPPSDDQ